MHPIFQEEPPLSANALTVLERRCLQKDAQGRTAETPEALFERVARAAAEARPAGERPEAQVRYRALLRSLCFLPNSPTLANAGTAVGQLAACFVLPVEDSLPSIFTAVQNMALIHQSGGGTGFSFSRLRPAGDPVKGTGGVASGPVSFLKVFDTATEVIKQGGRRRGANMGVLRADHPDILAFIGAKLGGQGASNFNLSVGTTGAFWRAVEKGGRYDLVNPRTGAVSGRLDARQVLGRIAHAAWTCGDPGLLFLDEINRANPTPHLGEIEATNPCGEQPLLPYESCTLGSLNLARFAHPKGFDWEALRAAVELAVEFLDDVITVNRYPILEIETRSLATRKIGLGVMGWADALIALGVPYASEKAISLAGEVMEKITGWARAHSAVLARQRGAFPAFHGSVWEKRGTPMRNATVTTIAPTGTLSILAGVSSGIEPLFGLSYVRRVLDGTNLLEVNQAFRARAEALGLGGEERFREIAHTGSIAGREEFPKDVREIFATALDIAAPWHLQMQAAFQRHTENAVSKTVNLPERASEEDVHNIYLEASRMGLKGITAFRYGSKAEQVLYLGRSPAVEWHEGVPYVHPEYTGECRVCVG